MAFQPCDDTIECRVNGAVGGIPFQNVYHVFLTTDLTEALADTYANVLNNAYLELEDLLSDQITYSECVVTDIREETGQQFTPDTWEPITGNEAGQMLPFQTAALVSWQTGTRGRSYRGRTYLGGFCENSSNGRQLEGALQTALAAYAEFFVGDPAFAICSRFEPADPPPGSVARDHGFSTPIVSSTVHPLWRTQRRRATA